MISLIIIDMKASYIYHYIMAVIAWIETEQERKFNTTWVINALFQLLNVIGEKQNVNIKEDHVFTGQDTWQEPIAGICSKIKVI